MSDALKIATGTQEVHSDCVTLRHWVLRHKQQMRHVVASLHMRQNASPKWMLRHSCTCAVEPSVCLEWQLSDVLSFDAQHMTHAL